MTPHAIPEPLSSDNYDLPATYAKLSAQPLDGRNVLNDTVLGLIRRLHAAESAVRADGERIAELEKWVQDADWGPHTGTIVGDEFRHDPHCLRCRAAALLQPGARKP